MDKQKIKSVPKLTTDNPVDNFQTALNFTDVSEDGWVWHISNLKIYDRPLDLRELTGLQETRFGMRPVEITSPPQSWRYVEDAECTS